MNQSSDTTLLFFDGSIVRAHQHAMGARGHKDEGINRSCGGHSTKIHLVVDSYGLPNRFILTGGAEHESKVALDLVSHLPSSEYIIADKGYDSEALRNAIRNKNAIPVIPRKKNSKTGNGDIDWAL